MRLDHIAYRVADRHAAARFLIDAFGYRVQTEFDLKFDDGSTTECIALEPRGPLRVGRLVEALAAGGEAADYHAPHEVFVSDGSPGSIVGRWVADRGGVGGVHHVAYQVDDVAATVRDWTERGLARFASVEPLRCPGLVQMFTEPHPLTGVVYELIQRDGEFGFCRDNVRQLMVSTDGFR